MIKRVPQTVVIGACLTMALTGAHGAAGELAPAPRCFRLIALFDEIVVTRRDHRLLQVEAHELADARHRRREAEVYCKAGRHWFGVHAIEDALERIGVSPILGAKAPAEDGG